MRPKVLTMMGGALMSGLVATTAASQSAPALPGSLDRGVLSTWLRGNTDLDPNAVISVSPANIIGVMAVTKVEPASARVFRAQIRSEVISSETIREAGNSSWAADVEVDCQSRRGKVNRILDFPQRNLRGTAREAGGSAEWVAPPAGTHLHTVVAAVCDAGFQRPLASAQQVASATPVARPSASPAPVATPPAATNTARQAQAPAAPAASAGIPAVSRAPAPRAIAASEKALRRSPVAVQIVAADTDALATRALRSAQLEFGSQLGNASMSVLRSEVGGKTVYRALVHGFSTAEDARSFCSAYKAAGRDCFIRGKVPTEARTIVSR